MRFLDKAILLVLVAAAVLLGGIMIVQIVLRYVLVQPFLGIEETSVLFGLWFYFLGAAWATRCDRHISVDLINILVKSPSARMSVRLAQHAATAAFGGFFSYYAVDYLISVMRSGRRSSYLDWPSGIWVSSMVVGFALMTLFSVLNAVSTWQGRNSTSQRHVDGRGHP